MISSSMKDIRSRVATALAANSVLRLRNVTVDLDENTVCLSGRVSSFYHKQLAQEVVLAIDNQIKVRNNLHVESTQ